jgi:hypothetical protein
MVARYWFTGVALTLCMLISFADLANVPEVNVTESPVALMAVVNAILACARWAK